MNAANSTPSEGPIPFDIPEQQERTCRTAMATYPTVVQDIAAGNKNKIGFLVGQFMKFSQGKGDPHAAAEFFRTWCV